MKKLIDTLQLELNQQRERCNALSSRSDVQKEKFKSVDDLRESVVKIAKNNVKLHQTLNQVSIMQYFVKHGNILRQFRS